MPLSKSLRRGIPGLLAMACLALFFYSAYGIYGDLPQENASAAHAPPPSPIGNSLQRVIEADLFGEQAVAAPTEISLGALELRGTFAAGGGGKSYAMIAQSGQPEKNYRVGERLPNGMEIAAVYPDRILVRQGGTQHVVYLRPPQ